MNKDTFITHIEDTYKRCVATLHKKNSDYTGDSPDPWKNFEMSHLVGVDAGRAIMVRMADKLARISSVYGKKEKVSDETIKDTLEDLINYTAILHAYVSRKDK